MIPPAASGQGSLFPEPRAPLLVSASRRSDLPAFYAPWLMARLRAGYCLAVNP